MADKNSIKLTIGVPLFESSKMACCVTDIHSNFVFVNHGFLLKSGYEEEELIGKPISILLGKDLQQGFNNESGEITKPALEKENNYLCTIKTGEILQVSIETHHIRINNKPYTLTIVLDNSREFQLENKLQIEKDRLQSAVEGANLGLWDFNFSTKEFYANDIWWEMLGYPPQQYDDAFKFYTTLIHPHDIPLLIAEKDRIVNTGNSHFDLQLRLRKKSGNYIWIHSQGKIIEFGKTNFINHAIGTHIDITKQKEAELIILESEKKYRLLTESLPNIIWTADKDGYLNYMNSHGLAFFGKTKNDLESWEWKNFTTKEDQEEINNNWLHANQTGTSINHVHKFINKEGQLRWFQVLVFPQKFENGLIQSWVGVASDIDNVVRAEKSLKLSNDRLRSLIDASPVAIYSLNQEGLVQDFWNPAAQKLLGWTKDEVMGMILPHINQENKEHFENRVNQTIEKGQYTGVISRKNKFGELKKLEITGGCIYGNDGAVSEIIVTLIDITELENNREKLKKSLLEKETLLQEIHHRVKNNLAIVVSLLQLQVFRSDSETEKYRLTEAQNRVHSIAMVHELLYQSEDFSSVDLKTYYDTLLKTIAGNMKVENQKVEFDLKIDIDSLNINQAIPLGLLINELTTNSLKYAFQDTQQKGLISLTISREVERIFVKYSDNGSGFDLSTVNFESGLGMKIIDALLSQLDAEYNLNPKNRFEIDLNFEEKGSGPLERAKD